MGFMMFLAVPGLALASFVFAFCLAGIWVSGGPSWSASLGRTMLAMLVVIIGMSLVLIEPAAISPAWLQYTLLVGVPAAAGFFSCRYIVARWSSEGVRDD